MDDAYEYGQIAAANSLSDVWAMGGEARLCMNILMFPEHLPFETVQAILRGGYDKVAEAEAIVVGGHTIKDDIPKYGCASPAWSIRTASCAIIPFKRAMF